MISASYRVAYSQHCCLLAEDYKTLAETHRNLHALLASSGQPSTELAKTNYFMDAHRSDYAGNEACREFLRAHPQMATRTFFFVNLLATVLLHAPTSVPTTSFAFGYSKAQTTTSVASAAPHIAESQRKLSVIHRTGVNAPTAAPKSANPAPGGGPLKYYCYKNGYQQALITSSSSRTILISTTTPSPLPPWIITTTLWMEETPSAKADGQAIASA
jgi:hypothetical protein